MNKLTSVEENILYKEVHGVKDRLIPISLVKKILRTVDNLVSDRVFEIMQDKDARKLLRKAVDNYKKTGKASFEYKGKTYNIKQC